MSTPLSRVLALDPATGSTRWTFDPEVNVARRYVEGLTTRGIASWTDTEATAGATCARRLFLASVDARLFAIDAADGARCQDFGDGGEMPLGKGVALDGSDVHPDEYAITSPPAVVRDVVVVGSATATNRRRNGASGVVRGFDARTGALRWSFDAIPRSSAHSAWNEWDSDAAATTGGGNVWSIMSADIERDLVFLPTASAAPDFYGGERPGRNDHANSVVALRGSTGELVWAFQVVHHDLWDYDVAAQPILINWNADGREIPAVVVGTKQGFIFVLHRETGVPLLPVEERAVPPSDVPGEKAWPTQPFPALGPVLHGTAHTPDSAFGLTDAERAYCRDWMARLRNEGIFTPPSLAGTLLWPGFWGGINWDGMAWDPERRILVTTLKRMAMVAQLRRRDDRTNRQPERLPGQEFMVQEGTPYLATRMPFVAPSGTPCSPPPWGQLIAVDLADGRIRWQRPLGVVPWLRGEPGAESWGSVVFGGPLLTAGGLVFVAASQDDRIRAFDTESGALLWEHQLPAGGQAAPMTYVYEGRQYVVIAAGGRSGIGSPGDWIVAFAMPERDRSTSAPPPMR